MVDKAKTKKMIRQFTPKRTEIAGIGGEPLELPNYSGVGDFVDKRGIDKLSVNHIAEKTAAHGVVIDNTIYADGIDAGGLGLDVLRSAKIGVHLEVDNNLTVGGISLLGTNATAADFPNAQVIASAGFTTFTDADDIGIIGEAFNSTASKGVVGLSVTTEGVAVGVYGEAKSFIGANSGNYYGIRGVSTATNIGTNYGIHVNAENATTNYSFFGANGIMYNVGQLQLPTSGSGAGILLGGDTHIYRVGGNQFRTNSSISFNTGFKAFWGNANNCSIRHNGVNMIINPKEAGVGVLQIANSTEFNAKSKMTSIGGFAIRLTNKTGSNSVAGQLVQTDTSQNDAVKLTGIDEEETIGVFLDGGV
ncbi:hypothetical protein LCGC14_1993200, partial [marine sediment metagenome]